MVILTAVVILTALAVFSFLEVVHRNNYEEYVVAGRRAISASRNYRRRAVEW